MLILILNKNQHGLPNSLKQHANIVLTQCNEKQ